MKSFYLFLFFAFSSTGLAAKTVPFYVPPVLRLDLDPEEWELPYILPYYFDAKCFEPGQIVEIKARNYNLQIKFYVKYLTEQEEKNMPTSSDYKVAKGVKNFGHFEAWQTRYVDVPNKGQLIWISNHLPNCRVFISTNVKIDDPDQIELTLELLSKIKWVEPKEIDQFVNYPIDLGQIEVISVQRSANLTANKQSYNRYQAQRPPLKDVQFHFTFDQYHTNQLQITQKKISQDQLKAYALGFVNLSPWNLIDSMSIGSSYYGMSDNSLRAFNNMIEQGNSAFRPFRKRKIWFQSDSLTICALGCDTMMEVWVSRMAENGNMSIQRSAMAQEKWSRENSFFVKAIPDLEPQETRMLQGQTRFLLVKNDNNHPTDYGIVNDGFVARYLDTKTEPLRWITHPAYNDEYKAQMIIRERQQNKQSYDSSPNYTIIENQYHYPYKFPILSRYESPDIESQRKAWEEKCQTPTDKIVIVMDYLKSDLNSNGIPDYWKVWVSNGSIVYASGLEFSDFGYLELSWQTYLEELKNLEVVQTHINKSLLGYAEYSIYKASDFVPRHEAELMRMYDELQPKEIPYVAIFEGSTYSRNYYFSDEEQVKSIGKQIVYPSKLKSAKKGGVIPIEITLSTEGKIQTMKPQLTDNTLLPLANEAMRLCKLLPFIRNHGGHNLKSDNKLFLYFYFQP